jgi:hypothetical protein
MPTVLETLATALDDAGRLADDAPVFGDWQDALDIWMERRNDLRARETELDIDAAATYPWPACMDHDSSVVALWQDTVDGWMKRCRDGWTVVWGDGWEPAFMVGRMVG